MWCRSWRFDCILLVFFRRRWWTTNHSDALLWLVVIQQLWLVHFDPCCSLSDFLSWRSAVARLSCCCCCCFCRGHPHFWNFYSTIPADVVRVKSYMNCPFDPARVVIRVTINKLYSVPERLVFGVARANRISRSCSLILSCIGLSVSLMYTLPHLQGIL